MAEHAAADLATIDDMGYADRAATYRRFLTIIKYCLAAIAIILILMAIFLA